MGVMQIPETRYARSKDGNVAYQAFGKGPFDLVFIPWWVSNIDVMWEEQSLATFLERLATFSRVLCFDKRGTGVSDTVPIVALPTLEQWSDDVRTVMEAAGSQRAVLLGHDTGGQMAMLFAATYPDKTSALVLLDSSARRVRDVDYPWGLPAELVPRALEVVEEIWGSGGNLDYLAPSVAKDERFRRWYGRYERLSCGPRFGRVMFAWEMEVDVRRVLPAIRVPTLVLHRSGDPRIRVGHGRYLAEHIAGAKFVELPGEDHLFYVGATEAMLGEVEEFLTGMRSVPESDRVLATILFTDIVGSTERAVALGDRVWRDLLETHHQIVRRELERYRGREIQFLGDGLLALFDGPARAIRCAHALTDAVRTLGLEIRAGLHTGEVELAGMEVRGVAVHIGSRIAAEAGAGEVVVSSTVKELVAGSGIRFTDRGFRVLKGVPEEWRLFTATNPRPS
jgi:pimeloyl-ACP methyl ester carboxylesterase